jgi:hypothetical protein
MRCFEDLLNIVTTGHELYAELPCDRALPQDRVQAFLGKPVDIQISIAFGSNKLRVDSSEAGLVEFSPGGIWVAEAE